VSNKIQILPDSLANKIAAGEVIQRPESAVKELLENAIDAEAKSVEVMIKHAGKALIQVCDDGIGMSEDDVVVSILKHATSKISTYEDLEAIKTLGFRGEALSSMAAVSQLEIRTERKEDEIGTLIRIDESGKLIKEKGSFAKGTCVSLKNLFYNTPARRNFLKTDATELKHIIDTFNKESLSHPQIHFKFYNDDEIIFDYPLGTIEERIASIFADNMLEALIPVEEKTDFMNIHGYIGKPSLLKKSKGEQYLFLNSRYVVSKQINHAVFSAYENFLEKGDYPFFILFLEIDPHHVDVNVHPSKLEVRFENEKDIYTFILAVIKKSLGLYDLVPSMRFSEANFQTEKLSQIVFSKSEKEDFSDRPFSGDKTSDTKIRFTDREIDMLFSSLPEVELKSGDDDTAHPFHESKQREIIKTEIKSQPGSSDEYSFIIQLHNKYILSQIKSGLMIIDQHVAHERILYEKALRRLDADLPFSQQLLFPKTIHLDPGRYQVLKEINTLLQKLGFDIKYLSKNAIVIDGVSDDVSAGSEEKLLLEIVEEYSSNQRDKKLEERDNIAKSYSCKAAIKAGDKLSEREMRLLIDQLFGTSMPYVCPHGRPIIIKISLDEFDRRFGRTS
jgi:DNA mismatch repair protein MutL